MTSSFVTLIAIPAGGHPAGLQRLLSAIAAEYGQREDVRVLVADNSPDGSARAVFDEWSGSFDKRARYVYEPERGYSSVRNAIIKHAGDADGIAMIDDDEIPAPGWLDNLRSVQQSSGADVVAGPVVSEFPSDAPSWYASSGVFELEAPELAEGADMPWCASNNTLVVARVFKLVPEGFDPKFNRAGGTDTNFFMRARLRGCRIVWTRAAVVHEFVPPSRLTRQWIFRRAVRAGNSRALIEFELVGGIRTRVVRAAKALALTWFGLGLTALACLKRDRELHLRALHRLGLAYGMAIAFTTPKPWAA